MSESKSSRAGPDRTWEARQIELAKHDPAAFAPLYEAYVDHVWRYAMSRLRDEERAADVTSQTFIRAIAAISSFGSREPRGDHAFQSWLIAIARNVVVDEVRRNPMLAPLDDADAGALMDKGQTPEEAAEALSERIRIRQALSHLPDNQRKIVELRAAGLKGAEIADLLGMSVAAVKTANHRAYSRLRDLLAVDEAERNIAR
ncbi:MAG: sigma-70 family RNA polymerase sigma factor [Thermomicrobiales bacterium]|nr:sigma-70 family RNA polymerase sigma factor [Thermomicrobiales bacterium]